MSHECILIQVLRNSRSSTSLYLFLERKKRIQDKKRKANVLLSFSISILGPQSSVKKKETCQIDKGSSKEERSVKSQTLQ